MPFGANLSLAANIARRCTTLQLIAAGSCNSCDRKPTISRMMNTMRTDEFDYILPDELILRAYNEAVRERYRFFSFGDAMLIV
jgi:hypothetical protein